MFPWTNRGILPRVIPIKRALVGRILRATWFLGLNPINSTLLGRHITCLAVPRAQIGVTTILPFSTSRLLARRVTLLLGQMKVRGPNSTLLPSVVPTHLSQRQGTSWQWALTMSWKLLGFLNRQNLRWWALPLERPCTRGANIFSVSYCSSRLWSALVPKLFRLVFIHKKLYTPREGSTPRPSSRRSY